MYLLAILISSWIRVLCSLFNWVIFCWAAGVLYVFWILSHYRIYDLQYFFPFCRPFHFLNNVSWYRRVLIFLSPIYQCILLLFMLFAVTSRKPLQNPNSWRFILMFSSKSVMFQLLYSSHWPILVYFYIWCNIGLQLQSFACRNPLVSASFVEETIIFSRIELAFL